MPAPIIDGLITFIEGELDVTCWDGEIPRYDVNGNPINPQATEDDPPNWPVVQVTMPPSGFTRGWSSEDPYGEEGTMFIRVLGVTRVTVEAVLNDVEALLVKATNWDRIDLGGPAENPWKVYKLEMRRWSSYNDEDVRLARSQMCYRGELDFDTGIHGVLSTK